MPRSRRVTAMASIGVGAVVAGAAIGGVAVARGGSGAARPTATTHAAGRMPAARATPLPAVTLPVSSPASIGDIVPAAPSGTAVPAVDVPALRRLTPPDAVVTLARSATPRGLAMLRRTPGVQALVALDRGTVRLTTGSATHSGHRRTHTLTVVGVPLTSIRGFTPKLTASSNRLWRSVARGELTVSYQASHAQHLTSQLGQVIPAAGARSSATALRIGALASLGLPGVQGLVSQPSGQALGLSAARVVLVAAPKISLDALTAAVHRDLGSAARIAITRPEPVNQNVSSSFARAAIPPSYLDLYRRAATTCPGLPWTVLAGIGTVETGNGRNVARSSKGAEGPMQFLPSTWAMYGVDADGDGKADIQDPVDAVFSAARYLCAAGANRGSQSLNDAIFSYNHAWWYVREVVGIATRYA